MAFGFVGQAAAQQRWAAVTPDSEGRVHFGWGSSAQRANAASERACHRISNTCATKPGNTDNLDDVFALMCCTNPRFACAVSAAATRQQARDSVTETFVNERFSNCAVKGYYSADTGDRL